MKKILYFFASALVALTMQSCSEDETLFPDYEKDWFALEDSSNPAQHAAYDFYKSTGIPAFFNDTIGSQQRVDRFGQEYTYFKTLSLAFSMGGNASSASDPRWNALDYAKETDVPAALDFIRRELLPKMPKVLYIHSILLVEKMEDSFSWPAKAYEVYPGMNTLVIANASQLPTYDAERTKQFVNAVLKSMLSKNMQSNAEFAEDIKKFNDVSGALSSPTMSIYNLYYSRISDYYITGCPFSGSDWSVPAIDRFNWAGFIDKDPDGGPYGNNTPTQSNDFGMYVEAYLNYTAEEFEAKYGAHDRIMTKYRIMKPMLDKILK